LKQTKSKLMRKVLLMLTAFLIMAGCAMAQERSVSGKVTSTEDGSSLPGVNVVLKGTTVGTVTDVDGNYRIAVPSEGGTLVFSFIGLTTAEAVIGSRAVVDLQMATDVTQLSEVVVTGYAPTLKKEFSGSSASVSTKDIEKLPVLSANQVLQGQTSGVFVTSSSGTPGGGINVRVRGQTSINGSNDPLYVVDGVPVVAGDITQDGFGGQRENALAGLNPQDIASIEVLKDASTTAIYGARGANGVVLITTKRGSSGKSKINLNVWTAMAEEVNRIAPLTGQQYFDIRKEALDNDLADGKINNTTYDNGINAITAAWDGQTNTDWLDEVFRSARISEYQLTASGGDNATRYFISGSYRDEEGVIIGSGAERITGRFNLDHTASDKLNFGTSLSFSSLKNSRIGNDNNIFGILSAALLTPSTIPVYDEQGNFTDALPGFGTNAVQEATIVRAENITIKAIGNAYFNYKIIDGLDFKTDLSYDFNTITEDFYAPVSSAQGASSNGAGNYNYRRIGTSIVEPTLRYSKNIKGDHSINAVIGSTWQNRTRFDNRADFVGFPRESITYGVSAAQVTDGNSYRLDYRFFTPIFGRVNYAYSGKYLASASYRRDGSSRFGPGSRFGNFYAFSAGWNFSEEAFLDGLEWLDLGKLRASYGVTGSDAFTDFRYSGTWGAINYQDNPALGPTNLLNEDLQWEETSSLDLGIELALFDNRVNLNVGYFIKNTTDLLFQAPVPESTGFTSVWSNNGEIENKGLEIDLSTINVSTSWGLKWTTSANISFLRNKVVALPTTAPVPQGFASAYLVGEPLNTFYALKFLGVDPATGESIFQDTDRNGVVNASDITVVGDHQPDYLGGFTNTLTYKGFTLDAFFQFVQGVDIYNNTYQFMAQPANGFGVDARILDRWRQPGDITHVPKATTLEGLNASDNSRFIDDGSYLRLKNVALAYDLPSKLLSKAKIRSARIYVNVTNLLTFTSYQGFDPEVSTFANTNTSAGTDFLTFPQTKMYTIGLNVGF
jgi:TonB-linked SusC/RagA family outer membrane protein